MSQIQTLEIEAISVDRIRPSPYQPRLDFDLEELRGSIIRYGIQDPLKVRKVGNFYELIDGERRWRIAQQEGITAVPCLVLEYSDEDADALAWRFNTERKDYSVEEKAKHFHQHQLEGMSARGIARIHGYAPSSVNSYLAIFQLPEIYRNYIWAGEFSYQKFNYLHEKGLINNNIGAPAPHVIKIIQQSMDQDLKQKEFERVVDDIILDLKEKQVEAAKKAAAIIDVSQRRVEKAKEEVGKPEVKEPETPKEYEEAAKALMEEAKRRKSPEQILEEKREKASKSLLGGKGSAQSKIEKAKDLGLEITEFEEKLEQIMATIPDNPDDAIIETKKLKKAIDNSIKFYKEEERRRRIEEELREEIEKEVEERTVQTMLSTPEYIEVAKSIPTPVITDPMKPVIIPKDEIKIIKSRYEEVKRRIDEIIKQPEVKERGRLFRNWNQHYIIVQGLQGAFCPDHPKGSGILVWSCCDLPAKEALKKVGDKFEESQKEK